MEEKNIEPGHRAVEFTDPATGESWTLYESTDSTSRTVSTDGTSISTSSGTTIVTDLPVGSYSSTGVFTPLGPLGTLWFPSEEDVPLPFHTEEDLPPTAEELKKEEKFIEDLKDTFIQAW